MISAAATHPTTADLRPPLRPPRVPLTTGPDPAGSLTPG